MKLLNVFRISSFRDFLQPGPERVTNINKRHKNECLGPDTFAGMIVVFYHYFNHQNIFL